MEGLRVADDYVTKPFSMRELRARVARLVRQSKPSTAALSRGIEATEELDYAATNSAEAGVDALLARLDGIVVDNLATQGFDVAALARGAAMSVRTLQRRLRETVDETPTDYLRRHRMEKARAMLQSGAHTTAAEVAAAVGLNRPYFHRLYRAWWGHVPAEDMPES